MKLLFVHERFGALGGAETNLHLAARELKYRGHALALLHGQATGQGESSWREVFPFCFGPLGEDPARIVKQALQQFEPELVYLHNMSDLDTLQCLVTAPIPVVRMVHDHNLYCMRSYKYNPLNRAVCRRPVSPHCIFPCGAVLARNRGSGFPIRWVSYAAKRKEIELNKRCDRLIVATHYMRQELVQNGFEEEKIEIHPPVPHNPPAELPVPRSRNSRNVIIYSGQIIRGKGVDVLLEALAQVKVPFECFIIGEGNHRSYCEKLSKRLGLDARVRFLGFLPQEKLRDYYQQANVMVMSSVWPEPFGAVGLEGMRYGLPVVGFDAGGIREWLVSGYNGFLVPWMDRSAFASRVEQLLLNPGLARQMGEHGARLVAQHFNFSGYITALEGTFSRVLAEAQQKELVRA